MADSTRTETPLPGLAKAVESVRRPYLIVFVMLAIITVFELQVPTTLAQLGLLKWQQIGILVITAAMKASLVALYYMHLKYEPLVLKWLPLVPLAFVAILVLALVR
jgi:caa(3)-type oxidase subunit IV